MSLRRSPARQAGTIRIDPSRGYRHLFWCPEGIRAGFPLEVNTAEVKAVTQRCPSCWASWRSRESGLAMVYVVHRAPGVKECYVGQAADAESRYYQHFMYGDIPFLPTIEGLEELVRRGEPAMSFRDRSCFSESGKLLRNWRPTGISFTAGGSEVGSFRERSNGSTGEESR